MQKPKELYRIITGLDGKILTEQPDDPVDDSRAILQGPKMELHEDVLRHKWKRQITDHKR